MYTVFGVHSDGREEGHVECATLVEAFMHLREVLASEAADPQGPIFRGFGLRREQLGQVTRLPVKRLPQLVGQRFDAGRRPLDLRRTLMADLPVSNTVLSEATRQAILRKAREARPRKR